MTEEWRPVKGYEGIYEVSSFGRVRSIDHTTIQMCNGKMVEFSYKGKIRSAVSDSNGYLIVNVKKNGRYTHIRVHRAVAEAFIPNPDNLPVVNHKDENSKNNRADNLEWCTVAYNNEYGTARARCYAKYQSQAKKPIAQMDADGNIIKTYDSLSQAHAETGINIGHISECCKGGKRRRIAGGYKWKYL